MKRRFLSILLAVVLALSFSLVTAVPMATPAKAATTFNVIPFVVQATGGGTAAWSASANHTGSWGVNIGTDTDGTDVGRVILAWNQNLSTITNMAYWYKLQAGNGAANWDSGPYVVLALDTTNDTSADTWVVHHMFAMSPGLDTTWLKWELSDGPIDSQYMATGNGTAMWHVAGATTIANASWAEVEAAFDDDTVLEIKIAVGDWASDIETRHYVDDIAINGTTYYGKIQDAIDTATAAGDTISVAAGTYAEDLEIPETKTNLELVGVGATAIIKGVDIGAGFENFDIMIKASGAKIHGFTIQGPDPESGKFSGGMVIGRPDAEIYNNAFEVTNASTQNDIGQAIQTWDETMDLELLGISAVDVDGLSIHNNTFTDHGTGTVGYEGIYINTDSDVGTGSISIVDNTFTGDIFRAITVERSNATISGNSIITDLLPANIWTGININDNLAVTQDAVTVTGNTIKGSSSGKGFRDGIRLGRTGQTLTNISVTKNTVQMNTVGIKIWNSGAAGVVVNYNDISGNTDGVQNDDTGVELDAQYNWYGGVAGPQHSTNPYNTEAGNQSNDSVSDDVDFLPWMIHDTLVSGWNIWSTPIAAATGQAGEPDTNTVAEALDFWTADSTKVTHAYYFDSSSQAWAVPTSLTPLQAVYLKLSASATIDVCVSDSNYAPPGRTMHLGWNLVGTADWDDDKLVDAALLSAYYGTGAVNLIGYQYVMSPSIHQTSWTFTRDGTTTAKYFVPTEGYWVYMVNQGVLNGFTYTPITP